MTSTNKTPEEYTSEEVCAWLFAIGLESKVQIFQENSIDGELLITFTEEDLITELGLSKLQARKVLKQLEDTEQFSSLFDFVPPKHEMVHELEVQAKLINKLVEENELLALEVSELRRTTTPPPIPTYQAYQSPTSTYEVYPSSPVPVSPPSSPGHGHYVAQANPPAATTTTSPGHGAEPVQTAAETPEEKKREYHVVKGAAGGAAGGAMLGAIGGAIAGDAGQGAKIGAAVGGTAGGLQGFAKRRQGH